MRDRVSGYVRLLLSALLRNTHDYGIRFYPRAGSGLSYAVRHSTHSSRLDVVSWRSH